MIEEQFKVRPDSFHELKKTIIIRTIPLMLLAATAGLVISFSNRDMQQMGVGFYLTLFLIMGGALTVGLFIGIKRQREIFYSYRLTFNGDAIIREQKNTPAVSIRYSEIKEITKNSNGSFTVKGNSTLNSIGVPAQIDNYDKVEELLYGVKQVSEKVSEPILQKYGAVISVLTIGLMVAVYLSSNKLVVGVCGTSLLGLLGYSFYVSQKSKNIDNKTRRATWMIVVVIVSIIGVMYFKLIA